MLQHVPFSFLEAQRKQRRHNYVILYRKRHAHVLEYSRSLTPGTEFIMCLLFMFVVTLALMR